MNRVAWFLAAVAALMLGVLPLFLGTDCVAPGVNASTMCGVEP